MSCQTVNITSAGKTIIYSNPPDYEKSHNFFLFGIMKKSFINVKAICKNKPVKQIQAQKTFLDSILSIVTLGIYTPKTISVWCGGKSLTKPEEEI